MHTATIFIIQWAIYVMTFIDFTKQNGVNSGGTLPENVWGEQCFAKKDFINSNKIACGCYTQYHNVNKYICASITGRGAGFWSESNSQFRTNAIISS